MTHHDSNRHTDSVPPVEDSKESRGAIVSDAFIDFRRFSEQRSAIISLERHRLLLAMMVGRALCH